MTSRDTRMEASRLRRSQYNTGSRNGRTAQNAPVEPRTSSSSRAVGSPVRIEGRSSLLHSPSRRPSSPRARSTDPIFRNVSSGIEARSPSARININSHGHHSPFSRRHLMGRFRSTSSPGSSSSFSLGVPNLSPRTRSRSKSSDFDGAAKLTMKDDSVETNADADRVASIQAHIEKEDSMIYLDGPQVYTCAQCRTHLTSHDDIISKSFHGRHGRAYLFDQCVNVRTGPAEDRLLITGMHSVCDIFCNRCKSMVGWTYAKAYEPSQKYKEGKYIIEKINLHLEENIYGICHPAGERGDKWRIRSMSWGSDCRHHGSCDHFDDEQSKDIIYEYAAGRKERAVSVGSHAAASVSSSPYGRSRDTAYMQASARSLPDSPASRSTDF